jgi:hypothetical protein
VNEADTFFELTCKCVKEIVDERMKALKERNEHCGPPRSYCER